MATRPKRTGDQGSVKSLHVIAAHQWDEAFLSLEVPAARQPAVYSEQTGRKLRIASSEYSRC